MRGLVLIFLVLLLANGGALAQKLSPAAPVAVKAAPLTAFNVVKSFPHDTEAFTQGLLFHNGVFYEGTGQYTQSKIRRVEIATGRTLKEWAFPDQLFGEGLTLFGDLLFGLSWRSGVGFALERESMEPIGYFRYEGPGWGLTDDERFLYMSDGTDRIYIRDPESFKIVRTIDVKDNGRPIIKLNELEWINGEIWANVWQDRRIARINPETGAVISWLDMSKVIKATKGTDNVDKVLNGIAYDPKTRHVFVTGKYWPKLYALEIEDFK